MIDYKSYVEAVILRGDFVLEDMESKISRLWIEGRLTDDERNELIQLATDHAKDVFQTDVLARLAKAEHDIWELQHPVTQYRIWSKGMDVLKHEIVRYDVTGDGELDLCQYNGGRSYTALSIGKIEGWNMLDRELNPTHTITRDADGGYVVTPIPEPEPEPEPTESDSEPVSEQEGTEVQYGDSEASETVTELDGMTKSELIQYADDHGVHVLQSWTKAEIIAAIREAE